MLQLLQESVKDVFTNHFGLTTESHCPHNPTEEGYSAQIPIIDSDQIYHATIWADRPLIQMLASILLCDDNPDEATLQDLTKELGNFIVGHAKMIASNRNLAYQIQTPTFCGKGPLDAQEGQLRFRVDKGCLAIDLKAQHA